MLVHRVRYCLSDVNEIDARMALACNKSDLYGLLAT